MPVAVVKGRVVVVPLAVVALIFCVPKLARATLKLAVSVVVLVTLTLLTVMPLPAFTVVEPAAKFVPVSVSVMLPWLVAADQTLIPVSVGGGKVIAGVTLEVSPGALAVTVGLASKAAV